jgi:hypothetical protein
MAETKELKGAPPGTLFAANGHLTTIIIEYVVSPAEAMVVQLWLPANPTLQKIIGDTTPQQAMEMCIRAGWTSGAKILIDKHTMRLNFNAILCAAARRGNVRIMVWAMKYGATEVRTALCEAAEGGHKRAMYKVMEHGAFDFHSALVRAAKGGFLPTIKLCLVKGASTIGDALHWAAREGNTDAVHLLTQKTSYIHDYNLGLFGAAERGSPYLIHLFLKHGANAVDSALIWAAEVGNVHILQILLSKGATSTEEALIEAARHGHVKAVEFLIKLVINTSKALKAATSGGHVEIVRLLISKGARLSPTEIAQTSLEIPNYREVIFELSRV